MPIFENDTCMYVNSIGVVCYTCQYPLGDINWIYETILHYREKEKLNGQIQKYFINNDIFMKDILDALGVYTTCCRAQLMTHIRSVAMNEFTKK